MNKNQFAPSKNTNVPIVKMKGIEYHHITTKEGNTLSIFYNPDNNLVVVDLVASNEQGGIELLRRTLDETKLLKHTA